MFEHAQTRSDLADRLGWILVALMFVVTFAALPLAAVDFDRRAPAPASQVALPSARPPCDPAAQECEPRLVLRAPARPAQVPSVGPL